MSPQPRSTAAKEAKTRSVSPLRVKAKRSNSAYSDELEESTRLESFAQNWKPGRQSASIQKSSEITARTQKKYLYLPRSIVEDKDRIIQSKIEEVAHLRS